MATSMDNHLLAEMYIAIGWTEVVVDPWKHGSSNEINEWCKENIKTGWMKEGNRWIIDNELHAVMFMLRWS